MGRDHAKRAAFEHPRDVFGRVGGHSHERRDAGCQRCHAYLAGGFDRRAAVLHIHVNGIEARGLGDLGNLDLADQPDRHGRHYLAALKLLLDVVAQDAADRHATHAWSRPASGRP